MTKCENQTVVLARVKPGTSSDPIQVQTIEVQITSAPRYSCISYITSGHEETIYKNDQNFRIDVVLAEALRALRSSVVETVWWAEGLTTESNAETPSVSDVKNAFTNAEDVRIWVGPGDSNSKEAVHLLVELADQWRILGTALGLSENWSQNRPRQMAQVVQQIQQLINAETLTATGMKDEAIAASANALAATSYFHHVKSMTAIVLAKEAIITTNEATISWSDYADSMNFIASSGGLLPIKCEAIHLILVCQTRIAVRRYRESNSLELLPMLQQARQSDCKDPRDRVFSILPIISPSRRIELGCAKPQPPLEIDYSASQQQVFINAAKHIIGERQDLLLWNEIPALSKPGRLPGLPSWVPDWSDSSAVSTLNLDPKMALRMWESSPFVQPIHKPLKITETGVLKAQAHIFSRVSRVATERLTDENFHRVVLDSMDILPPSEKLRSRDEFARTLIMNSWPTGSKPPLSMHRQWTSFAAKMHILRTLNVEPQQFMADPNIIVRLAPSDPSIALQHIFRLSSKTDTTFISQALTKSIGRRFFVLENGCLGLGFFESETEEWGEEFRVREGDVVAVFVGGYFPYLLRECGDGRFRLLGEVYVQGLMEAEELKDRGWFSSSWKDVEVRDVEIV